MRLNSGDQIRKRLQEFTGKKINIVLNDRTVLLATLQQVDDSIVKVKNMRLKTVFIPVEDINEIFFDTLE